MTKFRANVVCERTLAECAQNLSIGKYLLLGKGEETPVEGRGFHTFRCR